MWWGDKLDAHVVMLEEFCERVYRAAEFQVANESDSQAIHGPEFFANGKEVQERLSWVFEASIPCIKYQSSIQTQNSAGITYLH